MKALSQADLYVRIQVEFEQAWWDKIAARNSTMYVIDSTQGVDLLEGHTIIMRKAMPIHMTMSSTDTTRMSGYRHPLSSFRLKRFIKA